MNGSVLLEVNKGKDVGVTLNNDLKPGKHCTEVKTANRIIGYIEWTFKFKSGKVNSHNVQRARASAT